MNHIYRIVWNHHTQSMTAVAETAKGRGKSGAKSASTPALMASILIAACAIPAGASSLNTLPTGGQVTAGAASISSTANTLTVQQGSQRAAINWQSFSVGSGATVNFIQPNASSVILNRVVGTEQSVIAGAMNANGQVFLLNSNGVLFTGTSSVNVGGLVASTLNVSDADFMAGRNTFTANGSKSSVINLGTITAADGGYVALLGNQVKNEGVITARLGTAIMAAGDQISLNFNGDSLVGVTIDQGTLNALVENKQAIRADGGLVVLTAKGLDEVMRTVVNNTGEVRAQTVANRSGKIYLLGEGGVVSVDGRLDASAPGSGNGGFIETSGPRVKIADTARISTASALGLNGTWLIDPVDFTIAATGGDITGTALSAALGAGSVTIQTATGGITCTGVSGCGAGAGTNGDIFVNEAVSWSANNTLTLNAHRNININQVITASGTSGAVALHYGQGAVASGNAATYSFGLSSAGFAGKINLQAGNNFSTKLGSDGAVTNWTVVTSLGAAGDSTTAPGTMTLQGMAATASLAGNYVLGANIDASSTSTWNSNLGFKPIGSGVSSNVFSGKFDGLGHTVTGLVINRTTDYAGLIGKSTGAIRNVGLVGSSVQGGSYVGSLVGQSYYGSVANSYASVAALSGSYGMGGLVGGNYGGSIKNSFTTGAFTSTGQSNGGLVALSNYGGTISDSYSNVAVTVSGSPAMAGGLVGNNYGVGTSIIRSYATGNVVFNSPTNGQTPVSVGGLVGQNVKATISASYATGSVTIPTTASRVYAGGLAGTSVKTGNSVTNSYATGNVTNGSSGNFQIATGGLIGYAYGGTITNTYAAGTVTGITGVPNDGQTGGLIGRYGGGLTNSFYDSTKSPSLTGIGSSTGTGVPDVAGTVQGLSTANLQTLATFTGTTPAWDIVGTDGAYPKLRWATPGFPAGSSVWVMGTPSSPIYLRLTGGGSSVYGTTPTFGYAFYNAATAGTAVADATPTGSVVWSGAPTSTSDAGIYSLTYSSGITLGNSLYTLSPGDAVNWTVNRAPLTVTASNATKVYGQTPTLSSFTSSGLVNSETIGSATLTSSGTTVTAGVAAGPYTIVASAATGGTFNASNYTITYTDGALAVTPLTIAVAANSGATRVYDGTSAAAASLLNVTNAINGDTVTLGGNASLASANVGTRDLSSTNGLTVSNPNYTVTGSEISGSVAISAAPLTVTASDASKVYGQTPTLTGFTSSGLIEGQTIGSATLTSSGTTVTAGVTGSPYDIVASAATGGSFTPGNYTISYVNGALTVTPLAVTVAANSGATRVYDGTSAAAASLLNVTNAINGDTVTLGGNASLAGSNVGAQALLGNTNGLTLTNPNYTVVDGMTAGTVMVTLPQSVIASTTTQVPSNRNATDYPSLTLPAQGISGTASGDGSSDRVFNVLNPLPQISSAFGANTALTVISSPNFNEPSQVVSLSQVRSMLQAASSTSGGNTQGGSPVSQAALVALDVRVPVSRNSLADIVNGGVRLPDGVEQELFVVQAN